jgi:hypothetical protein
MKNGDAIIPLAVTIQSPIQNVEVFLNPTENVVVHVTAHATASGACTILLPGLTARPAAKAFGNKIQNL